MGLPERVIVPPASLNAYQRFSLKLELAEVPKHGVLTSFRLAMARSSRGVEYPEVVFSLVRRLTPEEFEAAEHYLEMFTGLIKPNARGG
jgi:hypothetical protein